MSFFFFFFLEKKTKKVFKEYPMIGIKNLNFEDYCIIMDKVESEVHLTPPPYIYIYMGDVDSKKYVKLKKV